MKREGAEINADKFLCSESGGFGNGARSEALVCLQIKVEVNERSRIERVFICAPKILGPS